ncbi:Protein SUPPRESSOR OF K(+) TRANSPORT GROWTH DEFECT 1 [Vigna angularis]|uniref:Protein SUPPRESSOR OF K(+) TRANSPORT GROWTH DEFECT 1 n=1 Tax=Phaseolus angularis TaxID=3914 RepID=A0A8T0JGT9_PHAAN|nr:Protein SUPPRESSOR OF K(+) TRANSPORT GROWTH DEFECT 1 [Vigna angularis]
METEFETPRDVDGHGTHITATAARVTVPGVSYYGVAAGTAQGGSPESRLAIYQVCFKYECPGSAILAAFDDAIADGVDVISVSIGSIPRLRSELKHDPNAIGAFHAVERSILVVASAGNSGPNLNTGVNDGGEAIVISIIVHAIGGDRKKMYSNFKEQAIEYVKQAVQEDNAGNYAKAFPLYMNALEYFKTHLKYEKNPKIKEAITQKFTEYLRRAEEIRAVLDDGGPGPASNGDAAVAARPKTKPKDGEGGGDGEDPEQAKLRAGLNSAIVREKPNVKWNDVAGLESAKQALQEAVILPVKFPQFFTGKRRPWRAFLLYGPPGTGKSYLAKAVATEAESTFFSVSSSDLVSKWMGESEKLVSNLFEMARESAPSIIFIDEIDSLCGQRGEGNESEASRRIKTELLVQMQGVGHNDQKVLVLAATNTPYALDQAIRRRFDKRIYIPLPDLKARQHMFKANTPNNLTESDFEYLASRTEGFSGSDISVCVKDVLFEPVRKTQDAMFFFKNPEGMWIPCGPKQQGSVQTTMQDLATKGLASKILPPPITRTDFEKVLARQRPTVSKSDLDVHERFTKEFGEEG